MERLSISSLIIQPLLSVICLGIDKRIFKEITNHTKHNHENNPSIFTPSWEGLRGEENA
jgi:hypothetical protein